MVLHLNPVDMQPRYSIVNRVEAEYSYGPATILVSTSMGDDNVRVLCNVQPGTRVTGWSRGGERT